MGQRQRSLRQERCPSLRTLPLLLPAHFGEAVDPRAREDTAAAEEGMGTLRTADLVAVVVLREAPEVDLDPEAREALAAPEALADLEAQVVAAQEADLGEAMLLVEGEEEDSPRLVEVHHRLVVIRVEVATVRQASGRKERIGVGRPTRPCLKF